MRELISRICEEINSHLEHKSDKPRGISSLEHESHELSEESFKQLRLNNSGISMMFIDGGLSEIVCSPSIAMYHLRLAMVSYKGLEMDDKEVRDYLMLSKIDEEDGSLYYVAKLFPADNKGKAQTERISIDDPSLKEGFNTGTITRFASMMLRFSELGFAEEMAKKTSKSIMVIDGSLQTTYTREDKVMDRLTETCKGKDVLLIGFPKTTSMLTESGQDITYSLRSLEGKMKGKMWYYGPVLNYHDETFSADIIYAKLHRSARRLFRIEISNRFENVDRNKVLGELATNSADPVFLGYPYGLIKADAIARVANDERRQLRARIMNHIPIEEMESSSDSHSVLDSIRF